MARWLHALARQLGGEPMQGDRVGRGQRAAAHAEPGACTPSVPRLAAGWPSFCPDLPGEDRGRGLAVGAGHAATTQSGWAPANRAAAINAKARRGSSASITGTASPPSTSSHRAEHRRRTSRQRVGEMAAAVVARPTQGGEQLARAQLARIGAKAVDLDGPVAHQPHPLTGQQRQPQSVPPCAGSRPAIDLGGAETVHEPLLRSRVVGAARPRTGPMRLTISRDHRCRGPAAIAQAMVDGVAARLVEHHQHDVTRLRRSGKRRGKRPAPHHADSRPDRTDLLGRAGLAADEIAREPCRGCPCPWRPSATSTSGRPLRSWRRPAAAARWALTGLPLQQRRRHPRPSPVDGGRRHRRTAAASPRCRGRRRCRCRRHLGPALRHLRLGQLGHARAAAAAA